MRASIFILTLLTLPLSATTAPIRDLVVVVRPGILPLPEQTAATVLVEEVEKRTGVRLPVTSQWPVGKPVIALTTQPAVPEWQHAIPQAPSKPEGYRLYADDKAAIWILAADPRGALYGVGDLLRKADWRNGQLTLPSPLDIITSPAFPIRGHQLGYRAQANSYDAWSIAQFEQYIRELTFFGVNSIEGIPFQDDRPSPVMRVPRRRMNQALSEICQRYGLDYWVWIPADFDLNDQTKRARFLRDLDQLFQDAPQLTGLFFPGGDPGNNPAQLVLPFLKEVADHLRPHHPQAKVWLSLQMFTAAQIDYVYATIDRDHPTWLGGLVAGPSSPPLGITRQRLAKQYGLRDYPDITHNKLSQYEVRQWDQALALTLGREAINPRPVEYAEIFKRVSPGTSGFISYSDGSHDDVNKTVWSALSWDPSRNVRDILLEYARVYFHPSVAEPAADAILGLENNWHGSLPDNQTVPATLAAWQRLEQSAPELQGTWRWQMCLLRAYYDADVQVRLRAETALERESNAVLRQARTLGSEPAVRQSLAILSRTSPRQFRARILDLCEKLFQSNGLQTGSDKYYAINPQRGAVLDFLDLPLNNRWWLEDEFDKIRHLPAEKDKIERLIALGQWEEPGPGSFYDNVGHFAKSPHVIWTDDRGPTYWWWDEGKSRARLTWQITMWPREMVYHDLDPKASYLLRTSGYGQALPRANGQLLVPSLNGQKMGEFKEFAIPQDVLKDGQLKLTWDPIPNESKLNWRQRSRLAEVWLIKR